MLEARIFNGILERGFELLTALGETAWAGGGVVTLVGADKEMMLKFRHGQVSFFASLRRRNAASVAF